VGKTSAKIEVRLVEGALGAAELWRAAGCGAAVCFEGIVRGEEERRAIIGLAYQVYSPMTERELEALAREVAERHGLLGLQVVHSYGRVGVGECSFRLRAAGRRRKQTIAAVDEFIDVMKKKVPIWKLPVFADEAKDVDSRDVSYVDDRATI
jgi:molybdopterin synthase catalytic subunit